MYKRIVDCEQFYECRESIGSAAVTTTLSVQNSSGPSCNRECSSSDHYNPNLRLLQIPRSSSGSLGFYLSRSKWDPYPWVSAVEVNTPAKYTGLKPGECVLEVNETDVLGMRISDIAKLVKSETIDSVSLLLWSAGPDTKCNPESLCCGPMPMNLERLSACMQTILTIIECPVCLETIAPPTLQCQNGHILCVKCRILSQYCPVCRQHFYPGRSLIAEHIYNSITHTFNLRNQDKLREKLFGAKYKRSTKNDQQREKQQHNSSSLMKSVRHEVNKLHPPLPTHKFFAKWLGKAYSMDNLSTTSSQLPASLLSMKSVTNQMGEILGEDEVVDSYSKGNSNSVNSNIDELSKPTNLHSLGYRLRPTEIAKQFSLSANDLSKKDNDGLIGIESSPSTNRLQYLQSKKNSPQSPSQMPLSSMPPPSAPKIIQYQNRDFASLGTSIATAIAAQRDDRLKLIPAIHSPVQVSCCLDQKDNNVFYLCPCSCGNQLNGSTLQHHVKADHCAPILSYGGSSAELSLPLRVPLDEASVLLMCDGKNFWIKLRTLGDGSITASALLQGSEDESVGFMMETRLRNRIGADQDENNFDVVVVNGDDDDAALERELITRSIVRSMMVTTWEDASNPSINGRLVNVKRSGVLHNRENIRMIFGEAIDYQDLLLKIIIIKQGGQKDKVSSGGKIM